MGRQVLALGDQAGWPFILPSFHQVPSLHQVPAMRQYSLLTVVLSMHPAPLPGSVPAEALISRSSALPTAAPCLLLPPSGPCSPHSPWLALLRAVCLSPSSRAEESQGISTGAGGCGAVAYGRGKFLAGPTDKGEWPGGRSGQGGSATQLLQGAGLGWCGKRERLGRLPLSLALWCGESPWEGSRGNVEPGCLGFGAFRLESLDDAPFWPG